MAAERNNNMKKILITMLCLLVFCFMLTGCTGGTTETTSTTDDKNGTTPQIPDTSDTSPIDSSDDIPGIDDSSSDIMTENPDGTTGAEPVTPSDSSFATTLPLFARLDFGTKTIAEDQKMTTHEYIVSAMTYNDEFLTVEFTEDSLKLTAKKDGTFKAAGDTAGVTDSELRSGYGTWAGLPFTFDNVGQEDAWRGYHQYMKIRILNPTENDKIAVQFNNAQAYASTQFMVMSIGKQKDTYQTYIYDLCYAATYASGKGVLLPGQSPGNNWTWKQNTKVSGLKFHLLGATCSYANAYLNNAFDEGETAADYDVYAEYFNRLDSRALIKAGNSVEIDYIVFGSTPGQLKGYHSYIESSSMAES